MEFMDVAPANCPLVGRSEVRTGGIGAWLRVAGDSTHYRPLPEIS